MLQKKSSDSAPLVSVLMIAYNQERYIDEAIRSVVLQQTSFAYELIIGDDASTDSTLQRIASWAEKYPDRIVVLPKECNLGLARNFIRTYQKARGKYVAICEGDDFWTDSHKLQTQVDFMENHPDCSLCFHRVVNFYEADRSMSLSGGIRKEVFTLNDIAMCNPITNVSVLYRREAAGELPEWMDRVTSYDFVMHLLCAEHGNICYLKRPMAVYRKLPGSIWTGGSKERRSEISRINRDLLIDHFAESNPEVCQTLRLANARNCLDLANYYKLHGNAEKETEAIGRALSYEPQWAADDVKAQCQLLLQTENLRPSPLCRCVTSLRRCLSRFLPVPRIKG